MISSAIRIASIFLFSAALAAPARLPVDLPAGTTFQIRLLTPIGTSHSKTSDRIDAIIIAPAAGVSAGGKIRGYVESVAPPGPDSRARLKLKFEELVLVEGKSVKTPLRLLRVDNARESMN